MGLRHRLLGVVLLPVALMGTVVTFVACFGTEGGVRSGGHRNARVWIV
jgi:hypothetical protein